jgi:hypothetical protein
MNEWVQPNQPDGKNQASLANKTAAGVRDQLRKQYEDVPLPKEDASLDWPLTGFLLRSAVVEGWRGLEVMAYRNLSESEKGELIKPFRIEQLSKDVMLGLFNGIIAQLVIRQPQEGLHFGLTKEDPAGELKKLLKLAGEPRPEEFLKNFRSLTELEKQKLKDKLSAKTKGLLKEEQYNKLLTGLMKATPNAVLYTKTLRELGYKNPAKAGEILQGKTIDLFGDDLMRDNSKGVINIKKLADKMKQELSEIGQLKPDELKLNTFTSAEFAVEMIEAAGEFTYYPTIKTS